MCYLRHVCCSGIALLGDLICRFSSLNLPLCTVAAAAAAAGKGVSSSAALEVAVMTALAAAHDCSLSSRELALLCQKAEVRRDAWGQQARVRRM
jgi:L-arabinokinase